MLEEELFMMSSFFLISCLHPADDVGESNSWLIQSVMSSLHHFERFTLKSPVMTETMGSSLFVLSVTKSLYKSLYKNFKFVLTLTWQTEETGKEAFFIF